MIDVDRIDPNLIDPSLDGAALFLDIDGTLLDIAPRPDAVAVPASLRADLGRVRAALGGALALVSGRAVGEIDRLFAPLVLPASGVHGAEFRPDPHGAAERLAPRIPDEVRAGVQAVVARHPGALFEDKGVAVAAHWRLAPEAGTAIEGAVRDLLRAAPSELAALRGHCVLEIKASALDKGRAVDRFMRAAPFAGRRPVFIGDDVTDEAAFAAARRRGGLAYSVGRPMEGAMDWFASAADVRRWIGRLASRPALAEPASAQFAAAQPASAKSASVLA